MQQDMHIRHPIKEVDYSWVGRYVKQAMKGKCPFCGQTIDFYEIDQGKTHKCPQLPTQIAKLEIKEFSDEEILLAGPGYLVYPVVERILNKYPKTRIFIITPP